MRIERHKRIRDVLKSSHSLRFDRISPHSERLLFSDVRIQHVNSSPSKPAILCHSQESYLFTSFWAATATEDVVTCASLLSLAHDQGLKCVAKTQVQLSSQANGPTAVSTAVIGTEHGFFKGPGDARPFRWSISSQTNPCTFGVMSVLCNIALNRLSSDGVRSRSI